MPIAPCNVCHSEKFDRLFEGKDRQCFLPGEFQIHQCRNCGLITVDPQLNEEELGRYYPDNYYSYVDSKNVSVPRSKREKFLYYLRHPFKALNAILYSKILRLNEDLPANELSRVLDIGCGDGRYLLEKRKTRASCFGVDINAAALNRLREADPEISTFCGNVWDAKYPDDFFDRINLCHVLEHVRSSDHLLSEIRRILKPGGLLRVQIPNAASVTFMIFRRFWVHLDVPRHVHTFSSDNLRKLFQSAGFHILRYRTLENSFSFVTSCVYAWNDLFKTKMEIMRLNKLWDSEIVKLLLFPYACLVNLLGKGDAAEFILKKS